MALTAPLQITTRPHGPADMRNYRVKDAEVLFMGAYVVLEDASGDVKNLADAAGNKPLGRVIGLDPLPGDLDEGEKITGDTSASEPPSVGIDVGGRIELDRPVTGVVGVADVGESVFFTDEDTITLTATASLPALGEVVAFRSTGRADVLLYSAEKLA